MLTKYYNQSAQSQNLPKRHQVDGFENGLIMGDVDGYYQYMDYRFEFGHEVPTWQEVLEASDWILEVEYLGRIQKFTGPDSEDFEVACFRVVQALRGDSPWGGLFYAMPVSRLLEVPHTSRELYKTMICFPQAMSPDYIPGEKYLVCLAERENYSEEMSVFPGIDPFRIARIKDSGQGETAVPRYNTEHHPFLNIPMEEIKAYLDDL